MEYKEDYISLDKLLDIDTGFDISLDKNRQIVETYKPSAKSDLKPHQIQNHEVMEFSGDLTLKVTGNLNIESDKHVNIKSGRVPSLENQNVNYSVWFNTDFDENSNPIVDYSRPKFNLAKMSRRLKKKPVLTKGIKHCQNH